HHRAHRAAEELEAEDDELDLAALDPPGAREDRVVRAALLDRGLDALGIGLLIDEAEGIGGAERRVVLHEAARIEQELDPSRGLERVVMAADRAATEVAHEVRRLERRAAAVAKAEDPAGEGPFLARHRRDLLLLHMTHHPSRVVPRSRPPGLAPSGPASTRSR